MHRVGAKAFRLFFQVEVVPRCTPSLLAPSCDEDGVTVRPHPSSSPTSTVTWKNGSTPTLPGSPPAEFSSCHHPGTRSAGDASPSSWSSDAGRQSAKACEAIQPALPDHADGFLVRDASSGQEGTPDGAVAGTPPPPGLSRTRLRHLSPWGLAWGLGPATCVLQVRSGPVVAQPYLFPVPRPRAAPAHCYLDAVWAVGSPFCLTRWSWSSHWLPLAQVSPHPSFS